jgi:hypothetical protein
MNLEIIIPDSIANNEEYMALFTLFQSDNLEKFFEEYAKDLEEDETMLDVYTLSDYLNDFIYSLFSSIIKSQLNKEEYPAHLGDIMEMWDAWYKRVKINCAKLIDKFVPEGKKKQLTKKIEEILQITKKIDRQTEHENIMPDYIKKLVENGYVKTDGITAIASLDNIAEFLYTLKLDNFNFKTLLQFRQHDGQPFAENSAKEAVKRANRA